MTCRNDAGAFYALPQSPQLFKVSSCSPMTLAWLCKPEPPAPAIATSACLIMQCALQQLLMVGGIDRYFQIVRCARASDPFAPDV